MWLYFFFNYVCNIIATIFNMEFAIHGKSWYLWSSVFFTGLASIAWSYALRKGLALSVGTPLISISLVTTIVMIGFIYYREAYDLSKILGIFLGIIAIILIVK
jgi:multidrug transporter EmrE-like cation transporter